MIKPPKSLSWARPGQQRIQIFGLQPFPNLQTLKVMHPRELSPAVFLRDLQDGWQGCWKDVKPAKPPLTCSTPCAVLLTFIHGELKRGSSNHLCFKWKSKSVAGQRPAAVSPWPVSLCRAGERQAPAARTSGLEQTFDLLNQEKEGRRLAQW